jgi:multimeric flavodoxin WrbA
MKNLFINGSPNQNGNTAGLAKAFFGNAPYETLNLVDYRINAYGQELPGDQFAEVVAKMKEADVVVIGSPLYWHNICGSVRNMLDRFYGPVASGSMKGKTLYFMFQGAAPEKWMLEAGGFTMKRFAALYGFMWGGMATDSGEAKTLGNNVR